MASDRYDWSSSFDLIARYVPHANRPDNRWTAADLEHIYFHSPAVREDGAAQVTVEQSGEVGYSGMLDSVFQAIRSIAVRTECSRDGFDDRSGDSQASGGESERW